MDACALHGKLSPMANMPTKVQSVANTDRAGATLATARQVASLFGCGSAALRLSLVTQRPLNDSLTTVCGNLTTTHGNLTVTVGNLW